MHMYYLTVSRCMCSQYMCSPMYYLTVDQESGHSYGPLLKVSPVHNPVVAGNYGLITGLHWGKIPFQSPSYYWQNSSPYGCRTEVLIFLLTRGCHLILEATHRSLP